MFAIIFISHHKQKHSKHFVIWQRDRVATWSKKIEAGRMQWLKMKLRFVNLILLLISSTCAQLGAIPMATSPTVRVWVSFTWKQPKNDN